MMIGERNHHHNQTVHTPPWAIVDDPSIHHFVTVNHNCNAIAGVGSGSGGDDFLTEASLQRYLPSNDLDFEFDELSVMESDLLMDSYSCDQFRMFEFKVRKCSRARSHDWTECPYVHPGEKARRRDPRIYQYSGTACPDFRKGSCKKGDACEFSHGVFECWLHPARYRTQPCKDGSNCSRRICFFAHSPDQIRVISPRLMFVSSPESVSPPSDSPPMSPMMNSVGFGSSFNEVVASLRQLQLKKVKSMPSSNWVGSPTGFGSPSPRMVLRAGGYCSLPNSPVPIIRGGGNGCFDNWEKSILEEEPLMERVESGRGLRARMFEKLSRENPLDVGDPNQAVLDFGAGW